MTLPFRGAPFVVALGLVLGVATQSRAQVAFPLKTSANGRYLVDQHTVPFLMTGDAPQSMMVDLTVAEATTYMADRKARGFNTLWINLVCKTQNYGCRDNGARYDEQKPFLTGAVDFEVVTNPNEAYFAQVDQILAVAASHNMLVLLNPMDTGGWTETLKNTSLADLRTYGRYVGNRYKNFDNILWLNGVDFQQWRIETTDAKAREVALGIKESDTRHLHTVQLDFKLSSSLDDPTWAPIIGLEATYTYFPTYAEVLKAYNRPNFLPVFMSEAVYEYENIFGSDFDTGTPETLRRIEYWSALSGTTGQVFGNGVIWMMESDWPSHLNTPGANQLGYLATLFGSRAWFNLVPDQTHTVVTEGYGTFSSSGNVIDSDYVTAAATPDGTLAMAYLPILRPMTVDMAKLSGVTVARWFDPTVGTFLPITGSPFPNTGIRSFAPPGPHPDGSGDWVLVLESNQEIVLANPGNQISSAGAAVSLQLVATDPYGEPLTYSATNLPPGLTINSSTGVIAGALAHTGLTTYTVTVTATNGTLTTSQGFTWTVNENTQPPVLTNPGNQTSAGGRVALQLVATDPDGTGLTYSATGLPPGLTVNSTTGLIAGTLAGTNAIYGVTVTASDGFLVSAPQTFTWTVVLSSPFVQMNYAAPLEHDATGIVTVPFTAAQTAGNLNVVAVGWADTTRQVQSIVDTNGNDYELAVGPTELAAGDGGPLSQSIYYAKNINAAAAGASAVTVTFTGVPVFSDVRIAEYRGVDRVNPVDMTAAAQGSSAMSDSGAVTITNANDLLVAANVVTGVTTAAGSGYTARVLTVPNAEILMDRVVTSTGSYNATAPLTAPAGWIMQLVAFRAAGGTLNHPPTLDIVDHQSSAEAAVISLSLTGGDPDGNPVTYSATGLPGGLSINATTGAITGTLSYASAGTHAVSVTVSDGTLTATRSFTFTVSETNQLPVLTAIGNRSDAENAAITLAMVATDPDGDSLTYGATRLPASLTINATTGTISGTFSYESAGPHTVTVTVNDGRAAANSLATTTFSWMVTNTNRAPTVTAIPNQTSAESASVTLTVSATDPDSDDVLSYSAFGLPQGLTINPTTGVVAGTVSYTTSGLHGVTVTVADGKGAANSTASTTFNWTVTNTNRPPIITAIPNQNSHRNATISLQLVASDPDGTALTYSVTNLAPSLSVNSATGLITGTLSLASMGTYTVTATASDGATPTSTTFTWTVTNRSTRGDFDGDEKTDAAIYRPTTGTWYIRRSNTSILQTVAWGTGSDLPVPGDYDGDGQSDVAVYRPSTGTWYVLRSSTGSLLTAQWGAGGDVPVPADYDGDGNTDIAVYRPSTGEWYIRQSSTSTLLVVAWGGGSDVPVPGDYDCDGKTDIAVYRRLTGEWYIRQSSTSTLLVVAWGGAGDVPVPADYDGDGKTDIGIYRPTTGMWYLGRSSTNVTTASTYQWGTSEDLPVPGDYDGDGKTDIALYRPSTGTWFVLKSSTNSYAGDIQWGSAVDVPVLRAW